MVPGTPNTLSNPANMGVLLVLASRAGIEPTTCDFGDRRSAC